jgi:hypothetical protein
MIGQGVDVANLILTGHGISFIVVGGQAVARTVETGTSDIDVMVTTADFPRTVEKLLKDPRIRLRGMREGVALFTIESARGVGLDVLDAAPFAGKRSGTEFYQFLAQQESHEANGIRYASTALVWYTRLLTTRWKVYAEKILVNILDGADPRLLERAEAIGRDFGTTVELAPRAAYVREQLNERRASGALPR